MLEAEKAIGSGVADGYILYLYGVIPGGQPLPEDKPAQVEALRFSTIAAIVEPVLASEFASETLDQKLQSVDWVAPLARKHNAVLEGAMRLGPVVPARLCTLFSDVPSLSKQLAQNEQRFAEWLNWLKDRQEWGIKVFCSEEKLRSSLVPTVVESQAIEAAVANGNAGLAYVLRKKLDSRLTDEVSARIDEVVEIGNEAIASLCVECRQRALLSEASTGRKDAMVLNAAILVDVEACDRLHAEVDMLASRFDVEGFSFELTGPWPTYSFCDESATEEACMDEPPCGEAE
jgi:hypothetical protein